MRLLFCTVMVLLTQLGTAWNFTIANGQIYTPGFAIVDAPQPGTPLGGDYLQVALDVTADGKLPLPPQLSDNSPSWIYNITLFMYSYETQKNFTISNGTAGAHNASLGNIMDQEPGSTVKHVNWVWPSCLVGNGGSGGDRGDYNISIRQNFRLNGTNYYTIFDLPIQVTNSIPSNRNRPSCNVLENKLLTPEQIDTAGADKVGVLFAPGDASSVDYDGNNTSTGNSSGSDTSIGVRAAASIDLTIGGFVMGFLLVHVLM